MVVENTDLHEHLMSAVQQQRTLTTEISQLSEKYHETLGLLHDTQVGDGVEMQFSLILFFTERIWLFSFLWHLSKLFLKKNRKMSNPPLAALWNFKFNPCYVPSQEDLRLAKSEQRGTVARPHYQSTYNQLSLPEGSLAAELDKSLREEMQYPSGYSPDERR